MGVCVSTEGSERREGTYHSGSSSKEGCLLRDDAKDRTKFQDEPRKKHPQPKPGPETGSSDGVAKRELAGCVVLGKEFYAAIGRAGDEHGWQHGDGIMVPPTCWWW